MLWIACSLWAVLHLHQKMPGWLYFLEINIQVFELGDYFSLVAAKSLQSCLTLCDPIDGSPPVSAIDGSPPGSPVPGILRQEHWSGLPFPSPMPESEKGKWSRSVVSDPQRPHGLQPTRLLCPWGFPGKSAGVGAVGYAPYFPLPITVNTGKVLIKHNSIQIKEYMFRSVSPGTVTDALPWWLRY